MKEDGLCLTCTLKLETICCSRRHFDILSTNVEALNDKFE